MTQVFKTRPLKAQTFFQKLFRKHPPENAVVEIQNLLASKPILDVRRYEISQLLDKYKNANIFRIFKSDIEALYKRYLEHCLRDKAFSEKDLEELQHLKKLLNLTDKDVKALHEEVTKEIYREGVDEALADKRLDEQERDFLEKLQQDLKLPDEVANAVYVEACKALINKFLIKATEDKRLSPEEDAEFEMLCKNLGINPQIEPHTKAFLDRLRLYWLIENAELPAQQVNIKLYKSETCYFEGTADWYELRTVTKRINYAGVGARVRIAKGVYYRVGTVAPQRITSEELTSIDYGTLYLTNKRVIFMGSKRNFTIRMERILGFTPYGDGVEIEKDAGRNPVLKIDGDADIFCLMLSRLLKDA